MSLGQWSVGLSNFMLSVWYFKQLTVHIIWRTLVLIPQCSSPLFNLSFYFDPFIYAPLSSRTCMSVTAFQTQFLNVPSSHSPKQRMWGKMEFPGGVLRGTQRSEVKHLSSLGPAVDLTHFCTTHGGVSLGQRVLSRAICYETPSWPFPRHLAPEPPRAAH